MGITGWLSGPIGWIASWILGSLLDKGIMQIDLSLTSLRIALEMDEYKELAKKAYDHATARVYTEAEKEKIREEYLAAIRRFGSIGRLPNPDGA